MSVNIPSPSADHLKRDEWARIGAIEYEVAYLQQLKPRTLDRVSQIIILKHERQQIINRGTARAKLHEQRGGRKPRGYRWTGT